MYWVARSRDIGHGGEGFEQTKRNIKDATYVRNKLGEDVETRRMGWVVDGFYECRMDSRAAVHCDAGAMDGRKTKGVGAEICGRG